MTWSVWFKVFEVSQRTFWTFYRENTSVETFVRQNVLKMRNIKIHKDSLLALSRASPSLIKKIIKTADKGLINALSEGALNLLGGNIDLNKREKRRLAKFKNKLRRIANKKESLKSRKKILQTGKFASILAGVLAPLLFEGIGALIKSRKKK